MDVYVDMDMGVDVNVSVDVCVGALNAKMYPISLYRPTYGDVPPHRHCWVYVDTSAITPHVQLNAICLLTPQNLKQTI